MDTHWCSYCDKAVSPFSDSLYCSDECLRQDALQHHPMLGYDFSEYRGFLSTNATERRTSWGTSDEQESSSNDITRTSSSSTSSLPHHHHYSFAIPSLSSSVSSSASSIYNKSHHHDERAASPPRKGAVATNMPRINLLEHSL